MKALTAVLTLMLLAAMPAKAQFAAQKEAQYIATLKAVVNYKIDDEENLREVQSLRENRMFNQKLARMLDKLQNTRSKNSANRRVYDILLRAGEQIYRELD